MDIHILAYKSDNILRISDLKDSEGTIIPDATITADIVDLEGNVVAGASNISIPADGVTPGTYETVLDVSLNLALNTEYIIQITALKGSIDRYWERRALVSII